MDCLRPVGSLRYHGRSADRLPAGQEYATAIRGGTDDTCHFGSSCAGRTQDLHHRLGEDRVGNASLYQNSMMAALTFGSKVGMFKSSVRLAIGDNGVNDRFAMRVVMDLN
jgi:hypothetical protein